MSSSSDSAATIANKILSVIFNRPIHSPLGIVAYIMGSTFMFVSEIYMVYDSNKLNSFLVETIVVQGSLTLC